PGPAVCRTAEELLNIYLARLAENIGQVRLLGEADSRPLTQVFVQLRLAEEYPRPSARNEWMGFVDSELRKRRTSFAPPEADEEAKEEKPIRPEELLRDRNRAVITGAPGSGKSTLLRWLAGKILNQHSSRLPVFLELKSLNKRLFDDCRGNLSDLIFEQAIAHFLHLEHDAERECLKAEFTARLAKHQAAIFLDGLDEVRNTDFFEGLCQALKSFIASNYGRNLLIISTRPYALEVRFQDATEMEIEPLNQRQVEAFLHHYYDRDPQLDVNSLIQKLQQRELRDLVRSPVLLSALVRRYYEKGDGQLTGDRLQLYESLVRDLAVTVDLEKKGDRRQFSESEGRSHLEFLERIAFKRLFEEQFESEVKRLTFEGRWLLDEAEAFCSPSQTDALDFVARVKATPLLREVAEDVWAFSHLTIQEYLAARVLARRPDCEAIMCRAYFNPTLVEMEALPMVLGLSREPDGLYRLIERLPESLNFAGLRLRARGLAYGAGTSQQLLAPIVDQLMGFISNAYLEEMSYASSLIRSFSGIGGKSADYLNESVSRLLKAEDRDVRLSAAAALGKIGGERAVAMLIEALRDQNFYVCWRAADALAKIGGEQAISSLIEALQDSDREVRRIAAEALGKISGERAIAPLMVALRDSDREVRRIAAEALGKLGAEPAVAPLIETLQDQNLYVCWSAADALGKIGGEQAVTLLIEALGDQDREVRRVAAEALGKVGGERAVVPLIKALQDQNREVRWRAASSLAKIGGEQAVTLLIEALQDQDRGVRRIAADALAKIGGEQAVTLLIEALQDADISVRRIAADALAKIGGEQAILPLVEALQDQNREVRQRAAEALGKIGDEQALEPLIEALRDHDREVRWSVATALEKIGGEPAVGPLVRALQDPDREVRRRAAEALGTIGKEPAVAPLIAALRDPDREVRRNAATALGKIGGGQTVVPLVEALRDQDREVRWRAEDALAKIGGDEAIALLIAALQDPNREVRWSAASALGTIGGEQAVALLIEALPDPDREVRRRAADALGTIGGEQAVGPLIATLQDPDREVRRIVIDALGTIGGALAIGPLIEAMQDPDREVRLGAAQALGTIGGEHSVAPLVAVLHDQDRELRWIAASALEQTRIELLAKGLQAALSHQSPLVRRKAAKVAGYYLLEAAESELQRLAEHDPDPLVKQIAGQGLAGIELKRSLEKSREV
ncbi:MAG TPA: HEAT repeat domain-containing protein, partial [Blastocatellia bacterium]|nr:HEAT repeat domain-containing protein [Blastocatellia bacterium]